MKKLGHIYIQLLMITMVVLLSSCTGQPTAAQIRADGQAYADKIQADQNALNQEQLRQFETDKHAAEMANALYWQQLRAKWKPAIFKLGNFAIYAVYLVVISFAISTSAGVSRFSYSTFKSAARYIEIRSGLAPIDPVTRLPYPIMFDTPQTPKTNSLLAKIQDFTGLGFYNPNGQKWTVINASNGQIIARYDENKPPDLQLLEVNRQAIINWQTMQQMSASGKHSQGGNVAEAMAIADLSIAGQPVHMDFDSLVKNVIRELKNEIQN